MNTLTVKTAEQVRAKSVRFAGKVIHVRFDDRREVSLPFNEAPWLKWLAKATRKQRANWTIEPGGFAIYWPDLDDGIEVCHLLDSMPLA
jgi:hypothetical protein